MGGEGSPRGGEGVSSGRTQPPRCHFSFLRGCPSLLINGTKAKEGKGKPARSERGEAGALLGAGEDRVLRGERRRGDLSQAWEDSHAQGSNQAFGVGSDARCPWELPSLSERPQLALQPLGLDLSVLLISAPKSMRVTGVQAGAAPEGPLSFPGAESPLPGSDLPTTRSPEGHLLPRL